MNLICRRIMFLKYCGWTCGLDPWGCCTSSHVRYRPLRRVIIFMWINQPSMGRRYRCERGRLSLSSY